MFCLILNNQQINLNYGRTYLSNDQLKSRTIMQCIFLALIPKILYIIDTHITIPCHSHPYQQNRISMWRHQTENADINVKLLCRYDSSILNKMINLTIYLPNLLTQSHIVFYILNYRLQKTETLLLGQQKNKIHFIIKKKKYVRKP